MAKGPRMTPTVKRIIVGEALKDREKPRRQVAVEVQGILERIREVVPGIETIERDISWARNHPISPLDAPWSLGIMAKADTGIPWEAVPFLLQCLHEFCLPSLDEIISPTEEEASTTQLESEDISRDSINEETPIRFDKIAELLKSQNTDSLERIFKIKYIRTDVTFTVRQAKWLWRMHLALPTVFLPENFGLLCSIAYDYALHELLADYLGKVAYVGKDLYTFRLDAILLGFTPGFRGKTFVEVAEERRAQNNERTHSQTV